jgi:hypothetical protein
MFIYALHNILQNIITNVQYPFKRRFIKHTDAPRERKCEAAKQQAMYVKRNSGELSSNYYGRRKKLSISYCEFVSLALVIRHAMPM